MKDLQTMATAVTRYGTHSLIEQSCPSCGTFPLRGFYAVRGVPVQSVQTVSKRDEALHFPLGDIHLAYCWKCGFITNVSFDPSSYQYSSRHEESQGFSETYTAFQNKLASYLVDNYGLHGKKIVEVGCGNGEFLALLSKLGNNEGIGFDPAFDVSRAQTTPRGKIEFIPEPFSEKHSHIKADIYIWRMMLEHIQPAKQYLNMVRKVIGDREDATVFFIIPEVFRILRELAFWDIYYEHCSYFSAGSIGRLFRDCGFDVLDLWTDFDGQYLMVEARPGVSGPLVPPLPQENDLQDLLPLAGYFSQAIKQKVSGWRTRLMDYQRDKLRVVLWGGGSRAVAFLTVLGVVDEINYVVDINPKNENTFIVGTGQQVVLPSFLAEYRPDVVIVTSPVLNEEIRKTLGEMNLSPDLVPVNA
jgi:SAM-dependent methyltransferase